MGPAVGKATQKWTSLPCYCQTPREEAKAQILAFLEWVPADQPVAIDTASCYQDWATEETLGSIISELGPAEKARLELHSKANCGQRLLQCLSKESVIAQCEGSLARLGVDCLGLYYLHSPDPKTDIGEAIEAIGQLHARGKIRAFGLSNYPAWKVVDCWHKCKARGVIPPTVYQGAYNVLMRDVERELHACCRELGIRVYHYNPLAGGLLAAKYTSLDADRDHGRFGSKSPISGAVYSARYWKQPYFDALHTVQAALGDMPCATATLRWLRHHSILSPIHGDGIIIGASTLVHLTSNLDALAQGPLPDNIVHAFDVAWRSCRHVSPAYFRGYDDTVPGCSTSFLRTFQPDRLPDSFP